MKSQISVLIDEAWCYICIYTISMSLFFLLYVFTEQGGRSFQQAFIDLQFVVMIHVLL